MNNPKPIYEFLVWDNCSNNCKFCFQRKNPRIFGLEQQKDILSDVLKFIRGKDFKEGSHVLIVGGELFDDYRRFSFLEDFFEEITNEMLKGRIDLLYLNTNLLFDEKCLRGCISILDSFKRKNLMERLRFTTSYDIEGRFSSEDRKKLFFDNIQNILRETKDINIVVNMILTKQFCNAIIESSFNIFNFMETNRVSVNLIPYIILDTDLSPERELVFRTISKLYEENPTFIINWLHNIDLKQPRKMFYSKNGVFNGCECGLSKCGHSENFKRYSSKGTCFVCDLKEVFNDCF